MTQHVYARVRGFHLTVLPQAPFRMHQLDGSDHAIDVEYHSPKSRKRVRVIPHQGEYQTELDANTNSVSDVVDIEPGPPFDHWQIETHVFICRWPKRFALVSNNFPNDPGPFDLVGENGEMIYVQTPKRMPDISSMCGPGQSVVDLQRTETTDWIELEYQHNSITWRQRHTIIRIDGEQIAVTMQTPLEHIASAQESSNQFVQSIRLT